MFKEAAATTFLTVQVLHSPIVLQKGADCLNVKEQFHCHPSLTQRAYACPVKHVFSCKYHLLARARCHFRLAPTKQA